MTTRSQAIDVELSVVNTNNRALLHCCLRSLPDACEGIRWHATVVDNASQDGSAAMVEHEFPWATVLRNKRRLGFSANHNQVITPVIQSGSARYVLVLNEDTELDPCSVSALVGYGDSHDDVGIVGPAIRGTDGRRQPSLFRFPSVPEQFWSTLRPGSIPSPPRGGGWLNGSCLLVRVEALREVGILDEAFFIFFEDTDLGRRFGRVGWRSAICQASTIVHHGHRTVAQPALGTVMELQLLRSRYLYFEKHYGQAVAGLMMRLIRVALFMRAVKAGCEQALGVPSGNNGQAKLFLGLVRYDPRARLPHELVTSAHDG